MFPSEIIQPLFDMANPESEIYRALDHQMKTSGTNSGPETAKWLTQLAEASGDWMVLKWAAWIYFLVRFCNNEQSYFFRTLDTGI